jgi:hypothetical protein
MGQKLSKVVKDLKIGNGIRHSTNQVYIELISSTQRYADEDIRDML